MNDSQTITITSVPADVPVSDDRGTVKGAEVTITRQSETIVGLVIRPEGPDMTCWIGYEFMALIAGILPDAIDEGIAIDHAADCADAGARGETRSVTFAAFD